MKKVGYSILQWKGCCGGTWKPSRDANISKSFGIGSRFNNLFFRLQIWINHISICIVIHLCFGIDSTTFAINMVPSGPAPVPGVEGHLSFPWARLRAVCSSREAIERDDSPRGECGQGCCRWRDDLGSTASGTSRRCGRMWPSNAEEKLDKFF